MTTIATDSPFSADEERALVAFAGAILPASAEYDVPGADDPAIAADILATARRAGAPVAAGLRLQDDLARALHGVAFADLDAAAKADFVARGNRPGGWDDVEWEYDAGALAGQRVLHAVVLQCYYRDDRVMHSLGLAPRPPFPEGFEVEQGDWSLLEPVRKRGRIYRPVS